MRAAKPLPTGILVRSRSSTVRTNRESAIPPQAVGDAMLRWLVLDLNSFFASCEQQENPQFRGKPVIVVPTMAETTCAIAASYPAKAHGITTGTLVHEARRLCPEVKLIQARHKVYVEYHHRIVAAIDRHIPVEEVMSIDEVACRLDKVQRDPAIARSVALAIKREIHVQVGECLTSSIGISANKLLAKLASNMQKPDGLVILPTEALPGSIIRLELRDIPGIGPNMAARLRRAGITDIATLWNCDSARLRLVWGGVAGAKMHELLHGADISSPKTERSSISHQHVLAPDDRSTDGAGLILRQLLVRAAQRLRDDGYYCRRLQADVKWLGRDQASWSDKRSFAETQDTGFLLHVLQDLWTRVPAGTPLRVGIALMGLVPVELHQPDLFAKPRDAKLVKTIDAVNAKFGKGALVYGDATPEHTSKIAFQRVPKVTEF
jgi:DNA polymerase IV